MRTFTNDQFDIAYQKNVLNKNFFEVDRYYVTYKRRYKKTLQFLTKVEVPTPSKIVEIGGGQIALLCKSLFGDHVTIWDVNDKYATPLKDAGVEFSQYDLLNDPHPPQENYYDVMVLCEVVEHLPVPLYVILEKAIKALKPGGILLVTTPNIFRLRNVLRLLVGMDLFCNWELPEKGRFLGHVTEFSKSRLSWQVRKAGMEILHLEQCQMVHRGSSVLATIGKAAALPLSIFPLWRDGLVLLSKRIVTPNSDSSS